MENRGNVADGEFYLNQLTGNELVISVMCGYHLWTVIYALSNKLLRNNCFANVSLLLSLLLLLSRY